jgi:hypothetical protein
MDIFSINRFSKLHLIAISNILRNTSHDKVDNFYLGWIVTSFGATLSSDFRIDMIIVGDKSKFIDLSSLKKIKKHF